MQVTLQLAITLRNLEKENHLYIQPYTIPSWRPIIQTHRSFSYLCFFSYAYLIVFVFAGSFFFWLPVPRRRVCFSCTKPHCFMCRVRILTTTFVVLGIVFVLKQWPEVHDVGSHLMRHLKQTLAVK